ncbi:NAD-dependent epimerase/dehydratase family protein [Glaciibacter superstes]|uniref:NAD-dependent epimerase/dehydratase family protein n=1 Tax=Glaciibacter superstes TaxID=501023 RepID=UPI0003B707FE|nr:NAD-dependent epimerase/dehydratase family protein [Glaciibacter superstes]
MKIAITGGTGFVGRHLAERFDPDDVVVDSRRTGVDVDDVDALTKAFNGCDVVAHCAGINREIGAQTYDRVHVQGTRAVIEAAERAGVKKIVMLSFLRARPACGSAYHESKWAAEELIRAAGHDGAGQGGAGLDFTILKAGMIYGRGDHLIDHLSHTVFTLPLFATVGLREKPIRPIPVGDLIDILYAASTGRMPRETVAVTGAEELMLSDAARRLARVVGRRLWVIPLPVWVLYVIAQLTEWTMKVPLIAKAQVRMLAEGVVDAAPPAPGVPADLAPHTRFTDEQIRLALPEPGGFGLRDLLFRR